jgi:uncharacterized protein (TIGR00255 family)
MFSMTGFGRAVALVDGRRIVVELRSVNHRGLDVKIRSRILAAAAEVELLRAIRTGCARGSVQVSVDEDGGGTAAGEGAADLSSEGLRGLATRLEALRATLGLAGGVDLATLAAFVRLERERDRAAPTATALDWATIRPAFDEALVGLREARRREGAALGQDLRARAAHLDQLVAQIRTRIPISAEHSLRRLTDRLATVVAALRQVPEGGAIDPGRLAQEAALLADRLDVSEELARLGAHLDRLRDLLAPVMTVPPAAARAAGTNPGGPASDSLLGVAAVAQGAGEGVGRPLEFLLQEVGRELNTLGTKAQDVDISTLVIAGKAELEKIREQAQNIE